MEELAGKNETASILPNSLLAYNSSFLTRGLVAEAEEYTLEDAIENLKAAIDKLDQAIEDLNTKIGEVGNEAGEELIKKAKDALASSEETSKEAKHVKVEARIEVLTNLENLSESEKEKVRKLIDQLVEDDEKKKKLTGKLDDIVNVTKEESLEIKGLSKDTELKFMAKSITNENSESQKVVGLGELLDHFNNTGYETEDGLQLEIKAEEGRLVLENTGMSSSLFNEIKLKAGADMEKPYRITILKGESKKTDKIAKLAFYKDGSIELEEIKKSKEEIQEEAEKLIKGYTLSQGDVSRSINIIFTEKSVGEKIFETITDDEDITRQGQNQEGKFKVRAKFGDKEITNVFIRHVNDDNERKIISKIESGISSAFRFDEGGNLYEKAYEPEWNSWKPNDGFGTPIRDVEVSDVSVEFEYQGETVEVKLEEI